MTKKIEKRWATPVGNYKVCSISQNYVYHKFLKLNYPNLEDAAEALRKSLILKSSLIKLNLNTIMKNV